MSSERFKHGTRLPGGLTFAHYCLQLWPSHWTGPSFDQDRQGQAWYVELLTAVHAAEVRTKELTGCGSEDEVTCLPS